MKMEYLDATGGGDYPQASPKHLIRLSEFTDEDRLGLIESIKESILKNDQSLELNHLSFIQADTCLVSFRLSEEDEGLVKIGAKNEYACFLSPSAYQNMIEIIRHVGEGHNWLTPGEYLDEPAFLISRYGSW